MRRKREMYIRARCTQIIIGIILLILSVIILIVASNAREIEGSDAGAALFLAPLGIVLIFTKNIYLS